MALKDFLNEILVVIVLFNRKASEAEAFQSLMRQGDIFSNVVVFLYDNSATASAIEHPNIIYRHDPDNNGVSKAYNEGFKIAEARGKQWMLLLDQDTQFDSSYFTALRNSVFENSAAVAFVPKLRDRYGITSPFRWLLGGGVRTTTSAQQLPLNRFRFLNSGLLIHRRAFENARGYEEAIPVYFSDIAFGERLARGGMTHFVVVDVTLQHSLSSTESISWQDALLRYQYFRIGAMAMGKKFGNLPVYYARAILRGIMLSWRYKKLVFIKSFFSQPT